MLTNQPLVSVVIPTYNRCDDLKRALMSVQQQTFTHWEIIIVDNHSEDKTSEMVLGLKEPRITISQILNEGIITRSRNLGISKCQGKYIAFLDSDDWWHRRKLEFSVKYLEKGADLVHQSAVVFIKLRDVPRRALVDGKERAQGGQEQLPCKDTLQRAHKVDVKSRLQNISASARPEGFRHELLGIVHRQEHDASPTRALPEIPGGLKTIPPRHRDVEQDDVRIACLTDIDGLVTVGRGADDVEVERQHSR